MTSCWYSSCLICLRREVNAPIICSACIASLMPVVLEHACSRCKAPLIAQQICGNCLQNKWQFETLLVPFYYEAMAKYLLHHVKFYQQLLFIPRLTDLLNEYLQSYFNQYQPDLIVPVPLHRWRILKRGFNQAHELARRIGSYYDIEVNGYLAKKVKHTKAQAQLNVRQRQKNLNMSFQVRLNQDIKHILLVDDVFTTGATVNTLAHEFKKIGVARVDVVTLFRAV